MKEGISMDIDKLIQDGDNLKSSMRKNDIGEWLEGQDYEKWKAICIIYVEKKYPGLTVSKNLIEATKGNKVSSYDEIMGILKALKESGSL
jgi:hypothetical protein